MNRPSLIAVVIPASAGLCFFAPGLMGAVFAVGALIYGCCLFDQLSNKVGERVKIAIHRQSFKPPSNFVAIGVILSVVCAAIGFVWQPQDASVPSANFFLSLLSIAGHFVCLGALAFSVNMIEVAPNFRKRRG